MPKNRRRLDREGVDVSVAVPGSPDEALALAVRISRAAREPASEPPGPPSWDVANFEEAFSVLAAREGGRLRDPRGSGGEVCFGDLAFDATHLSPGEARELYRQHVWTPTLCDRLPRAVALEVFDMAVFSGPQAALAALKVALRLPDADVPDTELLLEIRQADPVRLRARFLIARLADIADRLSGP